MENHRKQSAHFFLEPSIYLPTFGLLLGPPPLTMYAHVNALNLAQSKNLSFGKETGLSLRFYKSEHQQ